jgi:membrane-bound lytic murein transglycosylase D
MTIRNSTLSLLLLLSFSVFAQESNIGTKKELQNTFLDSIKRTFVHDNIASCVDSLWMKELSNLDIYNDLSTEIKDINIDQEVDYELPTALLKKRLAAMDAKSPFNIEYNQGLENIIKSFLKNRKKSFERLMAISEYYFPIFEEAMARQNVPLEIKYLAVVESALNPKAVSRVGATGLWQFMYQTGKQYNLDINTYVDERSDPMKASDAAALYMSNMYAIFGDWDLVLASYNSGPGNVAKAIRRSGGQQNFWNIRKNLPKETQGYVPAFLATMYIYEYHKEHGIVPNRAAIKHFATDTIRIKKEISFKQLSELLDIPVYQLQLLNPSYKRDVVPFIEGKNHYLRMPNDKIAIYTSNEAKIYAFIDHVASKRERPFESVIASRLRDTLGANNDKIVVSQTKYHKVKRGDKLSEIAGKYGVAMSDIKKWNHLRSSKLARGRNLKIYLFETQDIAKTTEVKSGLVATTDSKALKEAKNYKEETVVAFVKTNKNYKVKSGDNLGKIANDFNVTVADIKTWNNLKKSAIGVGQIIKIKTTERVVTKVRKEINNDKKAIETKNEAIASNVEQNETPSDNSNYYEVQVGDNLNTIAKKHNVSVEQLKLWNNLEDTNIQLESKLKIADIGSETTPKEEAKPSYKIEEYVAIKGDNLAKIAKKFSASIEDLKAWNNLADMNIQQGIKLIVSKKEIFLEKNNTKDIASTTAKPRQKQYFVQKGDSLFSIAKKHRVTISDIKKWNEEIKSENLKPGMKIKING